ncbi:ABC transporter transmembrane domain-containing protein [Corynebacterium doosanense]|uniref:ABC transporter transmembrane domain-containing protein n=1 Tax=Corynebacterium doosanense TaxID=1121358 RepID=UPI0003721E63|nr:ABC transporter ATP-binding protein [Corynebacterium doosanense]
MTTPAPMPALWAGKRRRLLVTLVALGVVQALLAVLMAVEVEALLAPARATTTLGVVLVIVSVLGVGGARWMERVAAEELGQDYVFEQRRRLVTSAIADADYSGSLGVTVTRASNDLSAVRNWVALGVAALVTGVPLIVVVLAALLFLDPVIGLAVTVPLALVAAAVPVLARITFDRARTLRRQRGRMSAKVADTVLAGESVRASGAVSRELRAIDRGSDKVVAAAIDRAWITGLTRALTATAASACTVVVVLASVLGLAEPATVASTLMLLGILAGPVTDLGRVIEYRQNYLAATRILAPLLSRADDLREQERERENAWPEEPVPDVAAVGVRGLVVDDRLLPDLRARPGDRIRMVSADPHQIRATVATLSSLDAEEVLSIGGLDFGRAPGKVRRELVGVASDSVPLERGSVARLTGFRAPGVSTEELRDVLDRVGLTQTIARDERGLSLRLKNGGQPWSFSEVAQLKLARGLLREPPLVLLEGIDAALDGAARQRLADVLADYPGVAIFSSAEPGIFGENYREWDVDGVEVEDEAEQPLLEEDDGE